jgi:hypothetical protein
MLEIGIGHADRSFAYHVDADGDSAWGFQPDLQPVEGIVVNYAGTPTDVWPEHTWSGIPRSRPVIDRGRTCCAKGGWV